MNKVRDSFGRFNRTPGTVDWREIDFWNDYVPYYIVHSRAETCMKFNISASSHKTMCKQYGYKKDWSHIRYSRYGNNMRLPENFEKIIDSINFEEYKDFYETHTREETCKKYNIDRFIHEKLCEKYDYDRGGYEKIGKMSHKNNERKRKLRINELLLRVNSFTDYIEYYKNHTRAETISKYNLTTLEHELILETAGFIKDKQDIRKQAAKKFFYNNIWFDSIPEVAVYIYCVDANIQITFEPIKLTYVYNNKTYRYFPDFKIDGKLIEIKGDHFFKEDGTMCNPFDHTQDEKYEAKHQCGLQHNVEFWRNADYKFAIDYCINTYGDDFFNNIRRSEDKDRKY